MSASIVNSAQKSALAKNKSGSSEINELKQMIKLLNRKVDSLINGSRIVLSEESELYPRPLVQLNSSNDVKDYCREMKNFTKETFRVLFLSEQNALLGDEIIGIGTAGHCYVQPHEIFRLAIRYGACAIVTIHNHPSGNTKPSRDDLELFEMIESLSRTVEIPIIDNLIV